MSQYQPPSSFPPDSQPRWGQQPQYQPQPPYQQPFQPPQKKSRKGLWIALAIVAAVLVFGCIGTFALIAASGRAVQTAANQAATQIATLPTQQPTSAHPTQQPAGQNNGGKPIVANDTWTVTLNSASTSNGDDVFSPNAGNVFLEVNVTVKNTSSSSQTASSLLMFTLINGTGQKYDESFGVGNPPDGAVAAGGVLSGTIAYEVPQSVHTFTLQFQPDITSSTIVQWTIKD